MHTKLVLGITLGVFFSTIGWAFLMSPASSWTSAGQTPPAETAPVQSASPARSAPTSNTPAGSTAVPSGYTMATVAKHANASSCWSAINGKVYDLTAWINQHPGGPDTILSLCGTNGSAAFNAQHGGQRRPANEMASFLLGTLSS